MNPDTVVTWVASLSLVVAVAFFLQVFRVVRNASKSLAAVSDALSIIGDPMLSDDEKQASMQSFSIRLFVLFIYILLGVSLAVCLPALLLWGIDRLHLLSFDSVLHLTLQWEFILAVSIAGIPVYFAYSYGSSRNKKQDTGNENDYSSSDQLIHRAAFASVPVQVVLSGLEDRVFSIAKRKLDADQSPVFIAGLPRAGTTILLNLCSNLDEFTTHTYRNMPFLMCPLVWDKFSSPFRKQATKKERAHGDGLMISTDSPEAMEEAAWMEFFPRQYRKRFIRPWKEEDENERFLRFYRNHMRKLAIQSKTHVETRRYISKNNLNIARIPWIERNFQNGKIVIPYRDPISHAKSLHRQHLNFLEIHKKDPFARLYMAAIGHFDFGENLRPVNFNRWITKDRSPSEESLTIEFWLEYWLQTYNHLITFASDRVAFFGFERLREAPRESLQSLGDYLDMSNTAGLVSQYGKITSPSKDAKTPLKTDSPIAKEAYELYAELETVCRYR